MIAHRLLTPDDRRFVIASWSASFKSSYAAGMIWTDDWATIMHAQIDRVISSPDAQTFVAYETKDPTFLYGFISGDTSDATPVVYYLYVKEPYRRHGIARGLFAALGVDPAKPFLYACRTDDSVKLSNKIPRARWNPLVVRYSKENARRWPP